MSEWKEYKLGEVLEIKYGKDHKKLNNGTIPCLGSGGIMRFVDKSIYEQESILIPRKGTLNNIMYQNKPFWTVDTMFWSKIDQEKVFPKFLYYQLSLIDYTNLNVGSAVPSLTVQVINEIDINLPSINEQKAIANVLSSLDDKIDLLNRQNAKIEKMAETLFRKWIIDENRGTINQLISIQNGYAFKSKDFKDIGVNGVVKIKNISGGIIDIEKTDFINDEVALKIQDHFKINTGDILIAMTGAEIGKLGIIPKTKKNLWLNQRVGLLKEKYKGSKYLAYLQLKSEFGQDYIENAATGSAQPNISGTSIEGCGFPILSDELIREYSFQIGELYDKVICNLGQIQTLTTFRETLLPKLMSSEVKVNL